MHISAQNLTRSFGDKIAVNSVSLEIQPGKILALLGPNGAGKSTMIQMLTGQLAPTSGTISVDGQAHSTFPRSEMARLGVMPQEVILWEDLNILENLQYSATLYRLDSATKKARIDKLISQLRLQPELKTLAKNLSGGYKRRLHLALSIIHDPEVIFLDEPTPGIDAQSRILLTEFIQSLADTGKYAVVLTDHYLEEAEKLADSVVIIDGGEGIAEGTVAELKARHGNGNLLHIHLDQQAHTEPEQVLATFQLDFPTAIMSKGSIQVLVGDVQKSLATALQIIQKNQISVHNVSVKEPSLEDIFLLLTGKDVRE